MINIKSIAILLLINFVSNLTIVSAVTSAETRLDTIPGVTKIKDVVIYEDEQYFSSFPSVIKKEDGEIIVAFRRAPDRREVFGEKVTWHVDPNSYLVSVRSRDNGLSWSKKPDLIYAHDFGGSQDPCMLQLKDGTIICTSYGWASVRPNGYSKLTELNEKNRYGSVFLGGYIVRSTDGGETWDGPIYPPKMAKDFRINPMNKPVPAYNRGALYEGNNGDIYWVVAGKTEENPKNMSTHLMVSKDKGLTWEYSSEVASDKEVVFNETSVYETPKGDIVAFLRTANYDDQACIARSTDGGKTFQPWKSMGFQGHPLQATRLPDNRVLLVYGYRHEPFGIRARILNEECTDYETAPETILRTDGGGYDIGYPWSVVIDENKVLVVYYMNHNDGTRYIAGTILEID
ncbi:sialidase family protein [Membranihabitans marinus]|uniref:sialidase family protein n=1 Tax=Membranihabitans marinus TaxID=1227546 RepID=UPI001F39D5C0|nr:sialidase family protein [Membranihabitans marinus]